MEIFALCDAVAEDRRAHPRDDLMTALVEAELDGERLDDIELNLFFITLVVAGNETTRNLINHAMLALHRAPRPGGAAARRPVACGTPRSRRCCAGAARSTTSAAPPTRRHRAPRRPDRGGDKVVMYYASANCDEDVFDDPAHLRRRPHAERPRHLRRRWRALLPRRQPRPGRDQGHDAPGRRAHARHRAAGEAERLHKRLRQRHQADADHVGERKHLMRTPICDDLGIEFPIFAFTHCRDVVVAVSKAGGFGVLGAVGYSPEQLEIELNWIDEHIGDHPYGVDIVIPNKYEGMDADMSTEEPDQDAPGHGAQGAPRLRTQGADRPRRAAAGRRRGRTPSSCSVGPRQRPRHRSRSH